MCHGSQRAGEFSDHRLIPFALFFWLEVRSLCSPPTHVSSRANPIEWLRHSVPRVFSAKALRADDPSTCALVLFRRMGVGETHGSQFRAKHTSNMHALCIGFTWHLHNGKGESIGVSRSRRSWFCLVVCKYIIKFVVIPHTRALYLLALRQL